MDDAPLVSTTTTDISGVVGEQQVKDLAAERPQLRFAADAESGGGEFHVGENGRHGRFEFDQR